MSRLTETGILIGPEGGKQIGLTFEGGRPTFSEGMDNLTMSSRTRYTIAQVNAGVEMLAGIVGYKYRLVDAAVIAVGGAATTLTSIDISGTQSGSAAVLFSYAQANLTENTMLDRSTAGTTLLAAGASFVQNDAGTGISIKTAGAAGTVVTHVDVVLTFTFGR